MCSRASTVRRVGAWAHAAVEKVPVNIVLSMLTPHPSAVVHEFRTAGRNWEKKQFLVWASPYQRGQSATISLAGGMRCARGQVWNVTGRALSVASAAKKMDHPVHSPHHGRPELRQCVVPQYATPLEDVPENLETCCYSVAALLLQKFMPPACKPTIRQSCDSLIPLGGSLNPSSIAQNER
ncbi:hypothetical protein TcCL_NonESM12792 [Trypanosoma cruzi]|nr:hypothetical protein TcCL_NonESM12792 [Trypanosoma cruzi]